VSDPHRKQTHNEANDFMTTQNVITASAGAGSLHPLVRYIVSEYRKDQKRTWYVAARPGYMRCSDGTMARDGSFDGGPEWTLKRDHALEFESHRAAALVRSKCPSAIITEVVSNQSPNMQKYTPGNLNRWTLPQCYFGAEWPEHFSFLGQSRDSDCLERANFDSGLETLKAIAEPADWPHEEACFQVVRESHWAVGWVEWIAIHEDATEHLQAADEAKGKLDNIYPVLDEGRLSEYETEEANTIWRDCYQVKERIKYIRQHSRQFEFRDFADMLNCVRGNYFAGYASEFVSR